ncbi:uncharacterized protein LOC116004749 [Ipomoea triloba]|uniref:uncharacterized protein LOC116004749 n=1 Tax=Ipomoea triloba TaxID=35885 RepID=UPI00125E2AFF|nr:uncharacterized protein LOC116004749 [Ipomoea triloba]
MGEAVQPPANPTPENSTETLSFKQIVANETDTEAVNQNDLDLISDDEEKDPDEEVDGGCPVIRLTKEEKLRLRSKWKQTLIVKVLGRSIGYAYLLRRLTTLWHPKARMELITIEGGYFLVKFASIEDYEFAKYGGPWMVLEHYLIVKEWVPNFYPLTDRTETVIVWVRFPCLSAEYYDHKFLMRVGAKIGRPINIDTTTSLVSRAMFAKICVEVDITKPLLSKFTLRRKVRGITYEGLHWICFKCGTYGHGLETCLQNQDQAESGEERTGNEGGGHSPAVEGNGDNGQRRMNGKKDNSKERMYVRLEITDDYGSWMVAERKGKRIATNPERNQT